MEKSMNASKHEKNSAMFFSEKPHLSNFKKKALQQFEFREQFITYNCFDKINSIWGRSIRHDSRLLIKMMKFASKAYKCKVS